jgi:hypothetical protein
MNLIKVIMDNKVRILIDRNAILILGGHPDYSTKEIDKEIKKTVKNGGQVREITLKQFKRLSLYEVVDFNLLN